MITLRLASTGHLAITTTEEPSKKVDAITTVTDWIERGGKWRGGMGGVSESQRDGIATALRAQGHTVDVTG